MERIPLQQVGNTSQLPAIFQQGSWNFFNLAGRDIQTTARDLLEGKLNYLCLICFSFLQVEVVLVIKSLDLPFVSKSVTRLIYLNVNIALAKAVDHKWLKKECFSLCLSEEMVCVKIEQRVSHWDECLTVILLPNVKGEQFMLKAHFTICGLVRGFFFHFLF